MRALSTRSDSNSLIRSWSLPNDCLCFVSDSFRWACCAFTSSWYSSNCSRWSVRSDSSCFSLRQWDSVVSVEVCSLVWRSVSYAYKVVCYDSDSDLSYCRVKVKLWDSCSLASSFCYNSCSCLTDISCCDRCYLIADSCLIITYPSLSSASFFTTFNFYYYSNASVSSAYKRPTCDFSSFYTDSFYCAIN